MSTQTTQIELYAGQAIGFVRLVQPPPGELIALKDDVDLGVASSPPTATSAPTNPASDPGRKLADLLGSDLAEEFSACSTRSWIDGAFDVATLQPPLKPMSDAVLVDVTETAGEAHGSNLTPDAAESDSDSASVITVIKCDDE